MDFVNMKLESSVGRFGARKIRTFNPWKVLELDWILIDEFG